MGIVLEIVLWFIIEVVFWGIMYWSGYLVISILTFGKLTPAGSAMTGHKKRRETGLVMTAVTGVLFWIGALAVFVIFYGK